MNREAIRIRMDEIRRKLSERPALFAEYPDVRKRLQAEYKALRRQLAEEEPVITIKYYPGTKLIHVLENHRMIRAFRVKDPDTRKFLNKLKTIIR